MNSSAPCCLYFHLSDATYTTKAILYRHYRSSTMHSNLLLTFYTLIMGISDVWCLAKIMELLLLLLLLLCNYENINNNYVVCRSVPEITYFRFRCHVRYIYLRCYNIILNQQVGWRLWWQIFFLNICMSRCCTEFLRNSITEDRIIRRTLRLQCEHLSTTGPVLRSS